MKKLLILILVLAGSLNLQAAISHIFVERFDVGYKLSVYGRLKDPSQVETLYIKDADEIAKIAGMDIVPEFALSKSPIRFWIHFADASNPDKVEGSISQIDFHLIDTFIFSTKTVVPTANASKDAVDEIKTIIDDKPVDK